MGVVLHWISSTSWYKLYLDGAFLVIIKHTGVRTLTLGRAPFLALPSELYTLRFRVEHEQIFAKAWNVLQDEPAGWMLVRSDFSPGWFSGIAGVRVLLPNNATIDVSSFEVRSP